VRNDAARSLITGWSDIVGLVIVDLRDPYFVDVARGVEAELQENGMRLLIADSDRLLDKQRQNIQLSSTRVAGIVVAPVVPAKAGAPWSRTGPAPSYSWMMTRARQGPVARLGSARLGGWMGRVAARRLLDRIRARNREFAGAT